MAEPFLGEIRITSFNFPPKGWALCNGQLLPINQNQALFSILGTTYGGDGRTTFGLPDLQGRLPVHFGDGVVLGERAGEESHTLNNQEMPAHTHLANVVSGAGSSARPDTGYWAASGQGSLLYASGGANAQMNPAAIANVGGSQPHNNLQPYLVVNFIIALQGIFPSPN
jgi:microcystin-dependent protein